VRWNHDQKPRTGSERRLRFRARQHRADRNHEKEKKIGKPEKGPKLKSIKGRWVLKKINPTMVEVILFEKTKKEKKKKTPQIH